MVTNYYPEGMMCHTRRKELARTTKLPIIMPLAVCPALLHVAFPL